MNRATTTVPPILTLPKREQPAALDRELSLAAGFSSFGWLELDPKDRHHSVRIRERTTWRPLKGISCDEFCRRWHNTKKRNPDAVSLDWFNLDDEAPHALVVRWRKHDRATILKEISAWAKKEWERQNGRKIRRAENPQSDLEELFAYRLKNAGKTSPDIAALMFAYTGKKRDDSWVRKAWRNTARRIQQVKNNWASVGVLPRAAS